MGGACRVAAIVAAAWLAAAPAAAERSPFERFRARLSDPAATRLRITVVGDSHTAADGFTAVLRAELVRRKGDGGTGVFAPCTPRGARRLWGVGETIGAFAARTSADITERPGPPPGFAGFALTAGDRPCVVTVARPYPLVRVWGSGIDLLDRAGVVAATLDGGTACFAPPPGPLYAALRPEGVLYATALEAPTGGVVDAVGVNGAVLRRSLTDALFYEITTDVVIIAFGTNELFDAAFDAETWVRAAVAVTAAVRRDTPGAECLMVGPFETRPRRPCGRREHAPCFAPRPARFDAVRGAAVRAATQGACGLFDPARAVDETGGFTAWYHAGLAQPDGVHLTDAGYAIIGAAMWSALAGTPPEAH